MSLYGMIILWENRIPEISQKVVAPTLKTGTWYMKGLNLSAEVMISVILI